MKPAFKTPTIVRSKNGDWFVKYFYEFPDVPGKFKEFRVRDGVNYIKDPARKEIEIQTLLEDITTALESGIYNPFDVTRAVAKHNSERLEEFAAIDAKPGKWTIEHGLVAFMEFCKWKKLSGETIRTYQTFVNNFNEWLTETGRLKTPASEFLETEYFEFVNTFSDAEDWTPRTYNNHVAFLVTLFNRLSIMERKIDRSIQYHINLKDLEYKTDKAEKNRAYSGIVADRVKKELDAPKFKKLKQFIKFIYLSCMRPKEVRLLQIQNIDIQNRQIKVTAPTGKTGDRFVPVSDELLHLLEELNFSKLPLEYFLFGKGGESGSIMFGRTYFSDKYRLIKDKLKLDIHIYTMYGWKHTRVIDLINAGFSDEQVMQLTGHTDYQAFLAYKRDLIVNTTVMKGKTIGWQI